MLVSERVARPGASSGAAQRLPEREPVPLGERLDAVDRTVADPPLGGVEDPAQRHLVGRVGQHPQVGQGVADLAALVEAHPADDLVGLPGPDEHLLEHPRLRVGPVEDRHVRGAAPAVDQRVDLLGDEAGLVALVVGDVPDDPLAVAGVRPQPLGLAALVVADHRVGGVQDGLGRAVVLLEQDRGGVREVLLEVQDVADVGAPERVDRLVRVTHDHELGRLDPLGGQPVAGGGQRLVHLVGAELVDQRVLRVVGVLVLVDEDVTEPATVGLPHLGEGLEQVHGHHDQVVEVERVRLAQPPLVERVRRGVRLLELVLRVLRGLVGVAQLVLVVGHPVQHRVGLVALGVQVEVLADQRHQALLVGGVVDGEVRLVAELVDLLAQDPHARGVEGRDPHDPGALADEVLDPLLHLRRGLVGERDREDRPRVRLALGDQPGDPPGEHPGLARPGAGDDQQRRALVDDGGALGLVETLEELVAGGAAARGAGLLARADVVEAGDREGHAHVRPTLRGGADGPIRSRWSVSGRPSARRRRPGGRGSSRRAPRWRAAAARPPRAR